jgi:CheY-like chemotaxis protein
VPDFFEEAIGMARQLLALSAGVLDALIPNAAECTLLLRVRLPILHSVSVLIVDDNVDTLRLYERYLANSSYRSIGLQAPGDAVRLASRLSPGAIVLDVMLPEIDGWELLGRLREAPATRDIPVIVSTILPQEDFARTLGAAAFLRKPFTQAQLLTVLDQVLHPKEAPPAR